MKDGKKYIFNFDYDNLYNLLCILDVFDIKDIYGDIVSIRARDIERIRKVR